MEIWFKTYRLTDRILISLCLVIAFLSSAGVNISHLPQIFFLGKVSLLWMISGRVSLVGSLDYSKGKSLHIRFFLIHVIKSAVPWFQLNYAYFFCLHFFILPFKGNQKNKSRKSFSLPTLPTGLWGQQLTQHSCK